MNLHLERLKAYQFWGDIWARSGWRVQRHALSGEHRVLDPGRKVRLVADRDECLAHAAGAAPAWNSREAIVLLHALGTTPHLLAPMARRLSADGFAVVNLSYPTLEEGVDAHARRVHGIAAALAADGIERISFVGHSLGGLVARCAAPGLPVPLGRIAFLGTPNQGSRLAQILSRFALYGPFFGPSGQDVLPGTVARMPVPDGPLLVVAGGTGRFGFNPLLKGDDDGVLRVSETRLPAAHDYLRVFCLHRLLPRHKIAIAAVAEFMNAGRKG